MLWLWLRPDLDLGSLYGVHDRLVNEHGATR